MNVAIAWTSSIISGALLGALVFFLIWTGRSDQVIGVVPFALLAASYGVPALVIALRNPENRLHWVLRVVALTLPAWALALAIGDAWRNDPAHPIGPTFSWFAAWLAFGPIFVPLTLVPLLFPTGSPPTERWQPFLWFVIGLFVVGILVTAFAPGPLGFVTGGSVNPFGVDPPLGRVLLLIRGLTGLAVLPALLGCLVSVIVRFKRARGVERQQMKWFVFAVVCAGSVPLYIIFAPLVSQVVPGLTAVTATLREQAGLLFLFSSILPPIAIGIAILRYRLYDIDLLINRTLVYGLLTAILGVGYFSAVLVLEALLRPLTGGNQIAVALSTLAVVGVFTPVRRRTQATVDRRFYRSRYDAVRTIDAFGLALSDEVGLVAVQAGLLGVVHTTMRPTHASLWLRTPAS